VYGDASRCSGNDERRGRARATRRGRTRAAGRRDDSRGRAPRATRSDRRRGRPHEGAIGLPHMAGQAKLVRR